MSKMKVPSIIAVVTVLLFHFTATVNASRMTFALSSPVFQEQEERVETVALPAVDAEPAKEHIPERYREKSVEGSIAIVNVDFMPIVNNAKTIEIWLGHDVGMVTAERTRFTTLEGTHVWRGTVKGYPGSIVWISAAKRFGKYGGNIIVILGTRQFQIETLKRPYINFLWEIRPRAFPPPTGNDRIGYREKKKHKPKELEEEYRQQQEITTPPEANTIVDVLILFSPELYIRELNIESYINELIEFTNQAFEDSKAYVELRVVAKVPIPYTEVYCDKDGLEDAWEDLRHHQNEFSDVHNIRDALGADLVVWLQRKIGETEFWGGSKTPPSEPITDDEEYAFAVASQSDDGWQQMFTFAHEIGHCLGLDHDPDDHQPLLIKGYGVGHYFGPGTVETPDYRLDDHGTIMTSDHYWVYYRPYYSEPFTKCEIGDVEYYVGLPNVSDASQAINYIVGMVAGYRTSLNKNNNYVFMTPLSYDGVGDNSCFFTVITPDKVSGYSSSLVICNDGLNPWSILPGAVKVSYAYGTDRVACSLDNGYTPSSVWYDVNEYPGAIVGNNQGAVSSSEVTGSDKAFSAVVHFKQGFAGERHVWATYWNDGFKKKEVNYGLMNVSFTERQPSILQGEHNIDYYDDGQEYTNIMVLDVKINDGNSATNIEKFYIYVTEKDDILPTDPDIVITPTPDMGPLICVRPWLHKSTTNYNNISLLKWNSSSTYQWLSEEVIYEGESLIFANHSSFKNFLTGIRYEGTSILFNTTIEFNPPFAGVKNVYLRAIDYEGNDTGYVQIGEINIVQ